MTSAAMQADIDEAAQEAREVWEGFRSRQPGALNALRYELLVALMCALAVYTRAAPRDRGG